MMKKKKKILITKHKEENDESGSVNEYEEIR